MSVILDGTLLSGLLGSVFVPPISIVVGCCARGTVVAEVPGWGSSIADPSLFTIIGVRPPLFIKAWGLPLAVNQVS